MEIAKQSSCNLAWVSGDEESRLRPGPPGTHRVTFPRFADLVYSLLFPCICAQGSR